MTRSMLRKGIGTFILLLQFSLSVPARSETRERDFSEDPGWDGRNNWIPVNFPRRLLQDFGYKTSNFAGEDPGEIGGYIQMSARPAYYGKPIDTLTLDDPLSFSGSFCLMEGRSISQWKTGVGTWIGFFNSAGQGFRPMNFLGFRFMGFNEPDGCTLEVTYGTRIGSAGGMFLSQGGQAGAGLIREWDTSKMVRIAPDGRHHNWSLVYDPNARDGEGEIVFELDSEVWRVGLRDGHRKDGAVFDRFGIFNDQIPGRAMTIYFDDLAVNGFEEDFSSDPGWEGNGNHLVFEDDVLYGSNRFGYSDTNHTGGEPGEIGGRFWRVEGAQEPQFKGYYGDEIGTLGLDRRLEARGKIAIPHFSIDTGMHIGFFNSEEQGWMPDNFIGVNLDSLTSAGRFFMSMYGTRSFREHLHPDKSPWFMPGPEVHEFSIVYDPEGADGRGTVTATLGERSGTLELPAGAKEEGAILNRFGIFNMQDNNGKHCEVYLDDLVYTVEK